MWCAWEAPKRKSSRSNLIATGASGIIAAKLMERRATEGQDQTRGRRSGGRDRGKGGKPRSSSGLSGRKGGTVNAHAYKLRDRRHYSSRSPQQHRMAGRNAASSRPTRVLRWVRPRDARDVHCGLALRIPQSRLNHTVAEHGRSARFQALGFVISTSMLHIFGLIVSEVAAMQKWLWRGLRLTGATVAASGFAFFLQTMPAII
jgi:hypothetical protein